MKSITKLVQAFSVLSFELLVVPKANLASGASVCGELCFRFNHSLMQVLECYIEFFNTNQTSLRYLNLVNKAGLDSDIDILVAYYEGGSC